MFLVPNCHLLPSQASLLRTDISDWPFRSTVSESSGCYSKVLTEAKLIERTTSSYNLGRAFACLEYLAPWSISLIFAWEMQIPGITNDVCIKYIQFPFSLRERSFIWKSPETFLLKKQRNQLLYYKVKYHYSYYIQVNCS